MTVDLEVKDLGPDPIVVQRPAVSIPAHREFACAVYGGVFTKQLGALARIW